MVHDSVALEIVNDLSDIREKFVLGSVVAPDDAQTFAKRLGHRLSEALACGCGQFSRQSICLRVFDAEGHISAFLESFLEI
jgi:hypothetical protein